MPSIWSLIDPDDLFSLFSLELVAETALNYFIKMATNKKHNRFVAEEPYILRIRDPELAQQIRTTLQNEGEAAQRKLEIIFDGT